MVFSFFNKNLKIKNTDKKHPNREILIINMFAEQAKKGRGREVKFRLD